jgi:predicted tellurium resistance membrane protein TerC
MGIFDDLTSPTGNMVVSAVVVIFGAIVAVVAFALLIPLDSVPAASGVTIIMGVAYAISVVAWITVMVLYARNTENLTWLNTHMMFLIVLPATIAATAMNVTSIQNTRNLLAGKVTG